MECIEPVSWLESFPTEIMLLFAKLDYWKFCFLLKEIKKNKNMLLDLKCEDQIKILKIKIFIVLQNKIVY